MFVKLWGVVRRIEPLPLATGPLEHTQFVRVEIGARRTATDDTPLIHSLIVPAAQAEALLRVGRIASIAIEMEP